ncbi:MAG: peptidase and in kexin sedolisin [Acidobacteria bacterium]|nr:peptidase and in kexin sedolisin [Acidobacteriota bacterium]
MKLYSYRKLIVVLIALSLCAASPAQTAGKKRQQSPRVRYPNVKLGRGLKTRGGGTEKLSAELRILNDQFATTRGSAEPDPLAFSNQELQSVFAIAPNDPNPLVAVAIKSAPALTAKELRGNGAKIYLHQGDTFYADIPVSSLDTLARTKSILTIGAVKAASVPPSPSESAPPARRPVTLRQRGIMSIVTPPPAKESANAAKSELTGKGVIVGVVDTGIDWRHPDFIRPDGSSRILYLWDMYDNSYQTSGGKIGNPGPTLEAGGDVLPGTVYTNAQIDAALGGTGTVNSMDYFGHGTAVAGTAAGNGRATANGLPAGTYTGVAPEADLIIVKASNCGGFASIAHLGTFWIAQAAKNLGRPVVINHSYGGHYSAHDGQEEQEQFFNSIVGPGKPGVAATVSAGNEGRYSLHAGGRFGPRRAGQADVGGTSIKLSVTANQAIPEVKLIGTFSTDDEWGLGIVGSGKFMADENGKSQVVYVYKIDGVVKVGFEEGATEPKDLPAFAQAVLNASVISTRAGGHDQVVVPLPPDNYWVWGLGITEKVRNGRFDLYLPYFNYSNFTYGADKDLMVGSPGNASNVITVAAYDFQDQWTNQNGSQTAYNLALSSISDYSSPGGRRPDGVFKPDIAAPATYTISSLSKGAVATPLICSDGNLASGLGEKSVTRDSYHIAWSGTSAASPFAAGVIALMLQKNPTLDSKQIRDILVQTAIKGDKYVGAVPNPAWGYGKINPAAAIAKTPLPK